MRFASPSLYWILLAVCSLLIAGCCNYPLTRNFGTFDDFGATPDPIPDDPAMPEFVTFLDNSGIPPTSLATFDTLTTNRHVVATLRHTLRGCFSNEKTLTLCFRARALSLNSGNDSVVVYNTGPANNTFPVIYSGLLVPALVPAWTQGTNATICIDLTNQMINNQIGDVLQIRVQDDTAVDSITMELQ